MKRSIALLTVVALAAFALGQAAPKPKPLKFPWLNDAEKEKLNADCGKTELEWRCATGKLITQPVNVVMPLMRLTGLVATPSKKGLAVAAEITTTTGLVFAPGRSDGNTKSRAAATRRVINREVKRRFCRTNVGPQVITVTLYEKIAGGQSAQRGAWDASVPVPTR